MKIRIGGIRLKLSPKLINALTTVLIYLSWIGAAVYASRWVAYQILSLVYAYWPFLDPTTTSDLFAIVMAVVNAVILLKVKQPKI